MLGDVLQGVDLRCRVFVFAARADAEGADDFVAAADGHAERAAHAGLFRAGLGHAAGVGLEIADGHGPVFLDGLAGDAFADGNGFDDVQHLRRQTDLRDEVQQLRRLVEPVKGAGLGMKLSQCVAENGFQGRSGHVAWWLRLQTAFDWQLLEKLFAETG